MKVVISGYYGFDNIGDEAILYSIIQALRAEDSAIEITVLSHEPTMTAKRYNVAAVNRWKITEVYRAIKEADGLISGGGSLMQDETGIRSIPFYSGVIKIAQLLKKPVFVYAQGMGPFNRAVSRFIVKHTLENTTITVRDQGSKQLLEKTGIKNDIHIVPDPVIGLKVTGEKSAWFTEQNFQAKVIAVSVREWPSGVPYKNLLAEGLDLLSQAGYVIVFVPMHSTRDYETSKEVASLMKAPSVIAPCDATIEEKIAVIRQADVLIGVRLHALIFAGLTYTPFVALSYDPKVDAFAKTCGQQVLGHLTKANWDSGKLFEEVLSLSKNRVTEVGNLKENIEPLKKSAQATAKMAIMTIMKEKTKKKAE